MSRGRLINIRSLSKSLKTALSWRTPERIVAFSAEPDCWIVKYVERSVNDVLSAKPLGLLPLTHSDFNFFTICITILNTFRLASDCISSSYQGD